MKALRVAAGGCLAVVLLGLAVLAAVITLVVKIALLPLGVLGGSGNAAGVAAPSAGALQDIPPAYLTLYQQAAATCPGLAWTVLAAIGKVESDHGRAPSLVSSAGVPRQAVGPAPVLGGA